MKQNGNSLHQNLLKATFCNIIHLVTLKTTRCNKDLSWHTVFSITQFRSTVVGLSPFQMIIKLESKETKTGHQSNSNSSSLKKGLSDTVLVYKSNSHI